MMLLAPLFISTLLPLLILASSFYENPEQDPLPPGKADDDSLYEKWGFEVNNIINGSKLGLVVNTSCRHC